MWIEVRRICETVQNFDDFENSEATSTLLKELEKFKWRIQNILRNPGKSAADRAKIIPDSEITIDDSKITIDSAICNEAIIISNIFDLNEMDAVELVLAGEGQKMHFDCLNRGLIAVVCYYDVHRLLAVLLNCILGWDKECLQESLRNFIEENFVQRPVFKHLLQLQSSFNVTNEFHMLMQPNINGLGGTKHQQLLRNVIDEIREATAECLYALCIWGADQARELLCDIYPILKGVPLAEKFSAHHLSAWIALVKLTSYQVLSQTNVASLILSDMVKEIRDETAWSDQSVCGTVQLACAIALRVMAVSPADHICINVDVDIDRIVDRAIRNMAMQFIRHGIIESESFQLCLTHVCMVDFLLKQLIAHFPAKLMEIERNSEDELCWIDDMVEKEQQVNPSLHYENLLRCISDLYYLPDDPKSSSNLKDCITELSLAYSSTGSMELCRFMEHARQSNHVVHAVAYLDMLRAVCRTQPTAAFIFDVFARLSSTTDNNAGWDHVMTALRSYERLFRDQRPSSLQFGHLTVPQQTQAVIPPRELAGLVAWINLARTVAELDDDAAELFLEERQWAVVDASIGVISSPVPILLKGALLRLLGSLAKKDVYVLRIWNSLNAHQICSFAENGTLLGLQQELDERECAAKQYDTSVGFVHLMRALLSHSTVPEFAGPYLQYLTKSIVSQLSSRSYNDVTQMWELAEVSLAALLNLINKSHTDAHAVVRREPHISLLVQILNDTPLFRVICGILLEDCDSYQDPCTGGNRPSEKAALAAIRLLSTAVSRHSALRMAVRATDSDVILASLQSLLLSPLQHTGVNVLDLIFQYLEQADDLPGHSLPAARLLRELCSVRPSLQNKMVDLLRSRRLVNSNVRAVRSVFNSAYLRYSVADVIEKDIADSDIGRMRGETARVVLEILSDSVETEPSGNNLCYLLFGFHESSSGQLFETDAHPTGFHQVLSILENFIQTNNPFHLPYSALFEPSFRLLQRLVSIDCIYSSVVLRFIRSMSLIQRLLTSPFLAMTLSQDVVETTTLLSLTRMIAGSILHLTALEVSSLLKTGHYNKPQEMYCSLLEASDIVVNKEDNECSVDNLLFSLLRYGQIVLSEEIAYPHLVHFNSHKLHTLFNNCKTTTVFNITQYDIEYLHSLLRREIVATQSDDTTIVNREMEAILIYGTDVNNQLLQRGASEQLISGCTALLNVMAVFAPVPFFSLASQLEVLTDAAFLLVEFASACTGDSQLAISVTLHRLCKTICSLSKEEYTELHDLRSILSRLLTPLLELLVQPGQRSLQAKISIYDSVRVCLQTCYYPQKENTLPADDWLSRGVAQHSDPVRSVLDGLAHEITQCVSSDIVDLPVEHKVYPLLLLSDLLYEDAKGSKRLSSLVSKTGIPRFITELLASLDFTWDALSQRESTAIRDHMLFGSLMLVLTRLSLTDCGWTTLAELAVPEVLAQLRLFADPPKQIFLLPASINQKNSSAQLFTSSFDLVIHLCLSLCAKPKWKRLSLKIMDVVHSQSELLSQLMRADITCPMIELSATLTQEVWESDEATRLIIDGDSVLKQLKNRDRIVKTNSNSSSKGQPLHSNNSFNAPSRLIPDKS